MANISTITDLVINQLSQQKYEQLCASGQLNPFQLYITDDDRSGALSNQIHALSNQLTSYYEKTETSSASQINGAFANLSNEYQAKGEYLTVESDPVFAAVSSTFLTSVPADYKTYDNTVSSLSNDGYLVQHQSLSNYYMKSETSSATEISNALSQKSKVTIVEWED